MKKALLVVSFGTSIPETREKTIYALERELAAAFPDAQGSDRAVARMAVRA